MKKLESKIDIAASPKKVWDTMTDPKSYREWINAGWPGSYYIGNWKKGENIKFVSEKGGGTLANLVECMPYEYILANHIAVINSDGSEDKESAMAKRWIGTTESYSFIEKDGNTELKTEMNVEPEWEDMLGDGWPKALAKLKEICER